MPTLQFIVEQNNLLKSIYHGKMIDITQSLKMLEKRRRKKARLLASSASLKGCRVEKIIPTCAKIGKTSLSNRNANKWCSFIMLNAMFEDIRITCMLSSQESSKVFLLVNKFKIPWPFRVQWAIWIFLWLGKMNGVTELMVFWILRCGITPWLHD